MLSRLLRDCWGRRSQGTGPSGAHGRRARQGEVERLLEEANRQARAGNLAIAETLYRRARATDPDHAGALYVHGKLLAQMGRNQMALECLRAAVSRKPDFVDALIALANTCAFEGLAEEAESCYRRALCWRPQDRGLRLRLAILLPAITESRAHIAALRAQMENRLDELLSLPPTRDEAVRLVGATAFFLAYHGLNDRPLQTKIARAHLHLFPGLGYTAPHCRAHTRRRPSSRRIRVGFLSTFFYNHSVGLCFLQLLGALARTAAVDVVLIAMGSREDAWTQQAASACSAYVRVPEDLASARQRLSTLGLDVLVYTDIGMNAVSYFLAFSRLAPVQCVLGGHPVTTGLPSIDYFISSAQLEGPGAQAHYSETLIQLRSWTVVIPRIEPPQPGPSRAGLGLPATGRLYVCPTKLQKMHPDFDAALDGILQADPRGIVVLFEDRDHRVWHQELSRRLRRRLGETYGRVRMQPWCESQDFLPTLAHADVILDPFHFGLATTAVAAFAVGIPVVTWPREFLRSRTVLACCRKLNIGECVANNAEDYIRRAVNVATDRGLRTSLRARILDHQEGLYGDQGTSHELAELLLSLGTDSPARP